MTKTRTTVIALCCALCLGMSAGAMAAKPKPLILAAATFPQSVGVISFQFFNGQGELGQFTGSGARLFRQDFRWSWFETKKGVFDFSSYDKIMKQCQASGLKCMFILYGANNLYPEFPSTGEASLMTSGPQLEGFARFAGAAAKYFKGKPILWELGNEPDGTGGPTPEAYVNYAKATVTAMRAADPNVCIIGPAAHHYATPWIEQVFAQGFLDLVDGVSVHLYVGYKPEDPQPKPEDNTPRVEAVRALMEKYGKGSNLPLINSEWGFERIMPGSENKDFNVSMDEQNRYIARYYLMSALWDLRYSCWFTWYLPASYVNMSGYQLVSPDWAPYPAYYILKNLTEQLPNSTLKRRMDVGSPDDYVLEFKTSKGTRWAVWTAAAGQTVKIPAGRARKMTVVDLTGTRTFEVPVKDGYSSIGLSQAVQYVW